MADAKVINKSGTLKMTDETAAKKDIKDISGKKMDRKNRRDRVKADVAPKEFDENKSFPLFFMYRQFPRLCKLLKLANII